VVIGSHCVYTGEVQCEVDQSGKVEQTNVDTYVAIAGEVKLVVCLRGKVKRALLEAFKVVGKKGLFPYEVFAAVLAHVIKRSRAGGSVVVDREYVGYENLIGKLTGEYLQLLGYKKEITISFGHVGKTSEAHQFGYRTAIGKRKPDKVVSFYEVLNLTVRLKKDRELLRKSLGIA